MDDIAMNSFLILYIILPYTVLNKFFVRMVWEGKKEVCKWKIKFKRTH